MGRGLAGTWKPLFSSRGIQRTTEEGLKRSVEVRGLWVEWVRTGGVKVVDGPGGGGCWHWNDLASWTGVREPWGLGVCRVWGELAGMWGGGFG